MKTMEEWILDNAIKYIELQIIDCKIGSDCTALASAHGILRSLSLLLWHIRESKREN